MATPLAIEAPAPQMLRRIGHGRWVLVPQHPVAPQRLPAPPAPQAERRLQRLIAECSPGPML